MKRRILMCTSNYYKMDKLDKVIRQYLGENAYIEGRDIREERFLEVIAKAVDEYEAPEGLVVYKDPRYPENNDRWIFLIKKLWGHYDIFDWSNVGITSIKFPIDFLETYYKTGKIRVHSIIRGFHYLNGALKEEDRIKILTRYVEIRPGIQDEFEKLLRSYQIKVKLSKINCQLNRYIQNNRNKRLRTVEDLEDWIIKELLEKSKLN